MNWIFLLLLCYPGVLYSQPGHADKPWVRAGADTSISLSCHKSVTLGCRTSNDIRAYHWTKISGPGLQQLRDAATATVTIDGIRKGIYLFKITVTDNKGFIAVDTIRVTGHMPVNYLLDEHTGSLVVKGNINGHTVAGSDTLTIRGRFNMISLQDLDGAGCEIVVDARNAIQENPVVFQQPEWYNLHYVKLLGLRSYNWYGTIKASYYIDHFSIESCRFINPMGAYKNQPVLQFDNAAYPQMIFTGEKKQTFHNIRIVKSRIEGFRDAPPLVFGSYWTPATREINRSILLDAEMYLDTVRNITNTNAAINVIAGTGLNMKIHDCMLDSTEANPGAGRHNHAAEVLWYGSIDFYNNRLSDNYAAALRSIALGWTGLPGYRGGAVRMYNNIIQRQLSFSPFEVSRNGAGARDSAHGFLPIPSYCIHNTIDSTVRASYNGDYYGFVLDVVNAGLDSVTHSDSVFCFNNVILHPEYDRLHDNIARNYVLAVVSRAPTEIATGNNKVFKDASNSIFDNRAFMPAKQSGLIDKAVKEFGFRKTDINGRGKQGKAFDLGAVEYAAGSNKTAIGRKSRR
jgi:hypothetical protein